MHLWWTQKKKKKRKKKKKKKTDTDIYFTGGLHGRDADFESDVYMYQREFEFIVVGMWERKDDGSEVPAVIDAVINEWKNLEGPQNLNK